MTMEPAPEAFADAEVPPEEAAPPQRLTFKLIEYCVAREAAAAEGDGDGGGGKTEEERAVDLFNASRVDLSGQRIEKIENLEPLDALRTLYLNGNQIRCVGDGLHSLRHLQVLSLAHNRIEALQFGELSNCVNLTLLDLDHNLLIEPPPANALPRRLRTLSFQHNPCTRDWRDEGIVIFHATALGDALPRLRRLNGVMLPVSIHHKRGSKPPEIAGEGSNDATGVGAAPRIKKVISGKTSVAGDGDEGYFRIPLRVMISSDKDLKLVKVTFNDTDNLWEVAQEVCREEALAHPADLDTLHNAMLAALDRCQRRQKRMDRSRRSMAENFLSAGGGAGFSPGGAEEGLEDALGEGDLVGPGAGEGGEEGAAKSSRHFVEIAKQENERLERLYDEMINEDDVDMHLDKSQEDKTHVDLEALRAKRERGLAEAREALARRNLTLPEPKQPAPSDGSAEQFGIDLAKMDLKSEAPPLGAI
mmetsp:Transcript_35036/g.110219  ORF Transcript_35036/g.110219 Transcript_35036/m.110219 type:complete len:475 (-) Transcript_35036:932-2356(-)